MEAWIAEHQALLWWSGVASAVMFVGSLIVVPILVVRLPEDYFSREDDPELRAFGTHPLMRLLWIVLKNLLGLIFLIAGVLMLVLPGQGLLTMLMGLMLLSLPGKRRAVHWMLHRGSILRAMNWLRQRAHRPPLRLEG
ncbi:MAG: hypothetical protein KDI71_21435 [Xanthomonadales bacterium]|nr:hypothetical protein [Xanthomonadales bacterium]